MLEPSQTVASIVLDHSETAPVFQRNRIDFCCKGHLTVTDACHDRGVDPRALLTELETAIKERNGDADEDPRTLSTASLIARIIDRHHGYLRRSLPFIDGLAKKVSRVHGDRQDNLPELASTVLQLIDALMPHLDQEETVLFPALLARSTDRKLVREELAAMHDEHLDVASMLERIRTLTDNFTPAAWACGSYRTLYAELEALEDDIYRHVHLENHVLSPRFAS